MGKPSTTVVGSKGAAFTAEAVYDVAHRRTVVELDSSSLERIAHSKPNVVFVGEASVLPEGTKCLEDAEARATLVVVLHKLLQGPQTIRKFLPIFITEVLNLGFAIDLPVSNDDSALISALVGSIYTIKNSNKSPEVGEDDKVLDAEKETISLTRLKTALEKAEAGEIGVTEDEMAALESSSAASTGIAALASFSLDSLTVVADAIVALSCEALQANTVHYESPSFKQAFIQKSEVEVATDLNSLLFGSKLVKARKGGVDAPCVQNVPGSHGALRDAVKILLPRVRVEINRVEYVDKKKAFGPGSPPPSSGASSSSLFSSTLLPLLISIWPNIYGSFDRTSKSLEFIRQLSPEGDSLVKKWNEGSAEEVESLRLSVQAAAEKSSVSGDENKVFLSRATLCAVDMRRKMLAKESTAALVLLSIRERLSAGRGSGEDGGQSRPNSEGRGKSAPAGKGAKVKKNFVLGKGTDLVRQSLAGYIDVRVDEDFAKFGSLSVVEEKLGLLLNPRAPELQALVAGVKSVLESNERGRLPKVAKGTRDFKPEQMAIREKAFGIIAAVFKRHGAVAIDTPVFELRETLMGKYGEDSKLIYDLADQGGEILSLRYDLTVPFARYLAMNKVENLKRYHIARVYRRDNPSKGRYREFYQCDFDIAGHYAPMVPDFEVLKVVTELLDELDIGDYEVKLNHRKLLDGMLDLCGVPQAKFRSICSAIDKLDKLPWEQVHKEMVEEKGLSAETADKIGELVQKRGSPLVLLEELKQTGSTFLQHSGSSAALEELGVLFKYLKAAKCVDRIVFDLSLARGLDYYTGVIYEAVFKGTTQVGSIAAGGRYDNLVGMFSGKQVPAVGVSLGIERVFAIMEQQEADRKRVMRSNETEVLVVVLGNDVKWTEVAIEIVSDLWEGRLKAEFKSVSRAKLAQQITYAATTGIPWVVIAGEDEINAGIVGLKNISSRTQEEVKRENLVAELQRRIGSSVSLPFVP